MMLSPPQLKTLKLHYCKGSAVEMYNRKQVEFLHVTICCTLTVSECVCVGGSGNLSSILKVCVKHLFF